MPKPHHNLTMDAAAIAAKAVRRMQNISAAEAEVAPAVGAVIGMDSAGKVYREALKRLGHRTDGVALAGMRDVFRAVRGRAPKNTIAQDAATVKSLGEKFPGFDRIRSV